METRRPDDSSMRLQKFLSRAGVASRREGERLMQEGRVTVDGSVVRELGTRVVPGRNEVRVDGRRVVLQPERWIALHKPAGYLTTRSDERGRRTIYSLLPEDARELFYAGRLDLASEGLILLTNAGDVAHRMLHPSYEMPRRYRVEVEGAVAPGTTARLEAGVELEDGPARAEDVELEAGGERAILHLTVREGRKREVRRMMEAVGLGVARLTRVSFGPISLGGLEPGAWRDLDEREVRALRDAVGLRGSNADT